EARGDFTACLRTRGEFLWPYLLRGIANVMLNDFRAAEEDYVKAQMLGPNRQALYGLLVNRGLLCFMESGRLAVPTPPPGPPPVLVAAQAAVEARRRERLATAAWLLGQAARVRPERVDAHRFLAEVCQTQGRPAAALAHLARALEAAGDDPALRATLLGQRAR